MSLWGRDESWRSRFSLYRDIEHARLAGVCAGIADYLGMRRRTVRIGMVLGLVFFFVPTIIAYIAFAVLLPRKPAALYANREDELFWRDARTAPDVTLKGLGGKFVELERRLAGIEETVISAEFDLRRKFRDLGG